MPALRFRTILIASTLSFFLWCTILLPEQWGLQWIFEDSPIPDAAGEVTYFWEDFFALLNATAPKGTPPERRGMAKAIGFDGSNATTERPRQENLYMLNETVQSMQNVHQDSIEALDDPSLALSYESGSRGIVTTAGGDYLPIMVISLRMLRRTGCTLPMEVFLATPEEWETHLCEHYLPQLNAKCIILSDLHPSTSPGRISKFQYKIISILASSFEEVLFLDADCWPAFNPQQIFDSELFKTAGMITFPDFWESTVSHYYYDITRQPPPSLSERQSTESGELFVSKKIHQRTLLLAAYYNYHGPEYYYPLLSQGAPGEGDKETFLAAASTLNESFYAVHESVRAIGRWSEEKRTILGSAMVQFEPLQDNDPSINPPRPIFVHNNFPRLNPKTVWNEHPEVVGDAGGGFVLPWTANKEVLDAFGFDVQRRYWEEILGTACELEDKFGSWKGVEGICVNTTLYFDSVYPKA